MLDKKIQRRYAEWMESPIFDENTKAELAAIEDEKEIEDRFYCDLSFGTSGMSRNQSYESLSDPEIIPKSRSSNLRLRLSGSRKRCGYCI